ARCTTWISTAWRTSGPWRPWPSKTSWPSRPWSSWSGRSAFRCAPTGLGSRSAWNISKATAGASPLWTRAGSNKGSPPRSPSHEAHQPVNGLGSPACLPMGVCYSERRGSSAAPMASGSLTLIPRRPARVDLKVYTVDLQLSKLAVGVDNIHYDVFLSPRFVDFSRSFLFDLIRQTSGLTQSAGMGRRPFKSPETGSFRKLLVELLQASL